MQEKQDADIRKRLCGKRILVLGPESDTKRKFLQAFRNDAFEISGNAEDMSAEDFVILFGFSEWVSFSPRITEGNFSELSPAEKKFEEKSGDEQKKKDGDVQGNHVSGWEMFSSLMRILRRIEAVHPESVLFVSRSDVYGKIFGEFHPVKEDETGYVCHTNAQDQEAARLRMMENLCFRMAREDGIAVKIARFPDIRAGGDSGQGAGEYGWKSIRAEAGKKEKQEAGEYTWQSTGQGQKRRNAADSRTVYQDWKQIASLTAKILLDGAAGEVYNVDFESDLTVFADTTALEPIRIVMDTGKAGRLG